MSVMYVGFDDHERSSERFFFFYSVAVTKDHISNEGS